MWASVAGPVEPRSSITRRAHGWRSMTARAAISCARRVAFQPSPGSGRPIWPTSDLDHAVEEVVLVPDVAVDRHRLDAQLLPELAHAERLEAAAIGEVDRRQRARARGSAVPAFGRR